jgi:sulfoxide reductase heme-binding subunit YedZ
MTKRSPSTLARRSCWALSLSLAAGFALYAVTLDFSTEREIWLLQATGWSATGALLLCLSMTPVRSLLQHLGRRATSPYLNALRRNLGIASAGFALTHATVALGTYLDDSWPVVAKEPFFRSGLLALAILAALLITSFPRIVGLLRIRLWKPLHRLSYPAALCAAQHLLLSPFADRRLVVGLFLTTAIVGCLRLLGPKRRRKQLGASAVR